MKTVTALWGVVGMVGLALFVIIFFDEGIRALGIIWALSLSLIAASTSGAWMAAFFSTKMEEE